MPIRQRLSLRVIAVIAVVTVVSVFGVTSILAVGQIRPLPRTVLAESTAGPTAPPPVAVSGAVKAPEPTAAPTPAPTLTLRPDIFWPGSDTMPQRPREPVGPVPSPTPPAPSPEPTLQPTHDPGGGSIASADGLMAVLIVGPSGETALNITRADEFAQRAEKYGMQVRRLYSPHATWHDVVANSQGANLIAYWGHGNGWPSIYGSFQEQTKDGFGLDRTDGDTSGETVYYGASVIRKEIKLAPNAVVMLSHLCYSAGNAEPGLPIPDWDVAWQRVDNHANGFLAAGARTVFAYGTGDASMILDGLFKGNKTMDQVFMTRGRENRAYYGFTGWDDRYLESTRAPGHMMHLDPDQAEGFLRAVTGDLEMTAAEWRAGAPQ